MSELWAQALTQAYHSYTHTLLGVVDEHVPGPNGPPVKVQENTALLGDCGLTGTPLRGFPCQGLERRSGQFACTASMMIRSDCPRHSRLRYSFFVVICAAWFSAAAKCTNSPYLPTFKAKADELGKQQRNQASLHALYASQADL